MKAKTTVPGPSAKGMWAVFWRAVVFTPVALAFSVVFLFAWCALYMFPVLVILGLWLGSWWWAGVCAVIWLISYYLTRLECFQVDRHEGPNGQENL